MNEKRGKFEYVYDENEGRRVITQTKNYPNVIGIYGDEYKYDADLDNYVKIIKTEKE